MKRSFYIIGILLIAATSFAEYRFPVGERISYSIRWGLLSCGTSTISCDEVEDDQKKLIRIRVRVKSNWLVSTLYPVDDTVDCYIDPETGLSLRLEKNTSEGGFICTDILQFDRESNTAQWDSHSHNISTNYPVGSHTCDAVSFLYALRQYEFDEDQSRDFDLAVDTALHGITITAKQAVEKDLGEDDRVLCRKYTATPKRDGLFVRKIPEEIWITEDDRKIMAKMVAKVPVGRVRLVLKEYHPPHS
jgi:hypothetical protein